MTSQNARQAASFAAAFDNPGLDAVRAAWPDQLGWCPSCVNPGGRPQPVPDIGPTIRCAGCGVRWSWTWGRPTEDGRLRGVRVAA